jgi:hypothetical protein
MSTFDPKLYYNLYVRFSDKEYYVIFAAATKDEIDRYFKHVSNKEFGFKPFGNRKINVVEPDSFYIYDNSTYIFNFTAKNRNELIQKIEDQLNLEQDVFKTLGAIGIDVTDSFGYSLEDVLSGNKSKVINASNQIDKDDNKKEQSLIVNNEYFNLYISPSQKESYDFIIVVLTEEQVYDYFKALVDNKKTISINKQREVNVVGVRDYYIYDFSIAQKNGKQKLIKYKDFMSFCNQKGNASTKLTRRFFKDIGVDVTSRFSSKIAEILKGKISKTEDITKPEYTETETINYFHINPSQYNILDRNIPACFNVDKTANVLANHLLNLSLEESGQMVGIFGKWGRGKTYFVEKLCEPLHIKYNEEIGNENFHFVKFLAWKYQETPASWAYLYETIANKYLGENEFEKLYRRFCLNIKREKWGLVKDFLLILFVWTSIVVLFHLIKINSTGFIGDFINFFKTNAVLTLISGTTFTSLIKFYQKKGVDALALIKKYTKGVSFDKHLGIQAEIEKELAVLLEVWMPNPNQKRLLLFVDDIDRCSEDKIISLIDSLRVMLEHPKIIERVIVLVAVDEEKLKLAIRKKYDLLLIDTNKDTKENKLKIIEREYMDKLFISGIKLHPIDDESKLEFAKNLLLTDYRLNNMKEFTAFEALQKKPEITVKLAENETTHEQKMKTTESATTIINLVDLENDLEIWFNSIEFYEADLTPRQIRILYYRYKLAKNLLAEYWGDTNSLTKEDLDTLLEKIKVRTFNPEYQESETDTLSQIAEMVVGY